MRMQLMQFDYELARFPRVRRFAARKFLAILCRAGPAHVPEGLRKMLLALEATGHSYIHYSPIGGAQHLFGALYPVTPEELMRGLAG